MEAGLRGIRVLDFSGQIAGPYCTKMLCDAGAEVIKVEPPAGDPLRSWSATGADLGGEDAAFFRFLNAGKKSVVGAVGDPEVEALLAEADLVVEASGLAVDGGVRLDVEALRARHPSLVVISITPFGLDGPWRDRPATEFTVQAEAGSIANRGLPGQEPYQEGNRLTEWLGGTFASVASLAAVRRARQTGEGEHIDFSLMEVTNLAATIFSDLTFLLMNGGDQEAVPGWPAQSVETPSIEPTSDGYVGFCTNTRQQFSDFLLLIERPDLRDDEELAQVGGRMVRLQEWMEIVASYTSKHPTEEIIEGASLLRIPVAPICNGETVQQHEQLAARGVFVPDATGSFVQPRPAYRIDDQDPAPPKPAPRLGEHNGRGGFETSAPTSKTDDQPKGRLPLEGMRILDTTAWWAGPSSTHMLATLGAEVIHVESATRPDGMRMVGGMMAEHYPDWWEASQVFLACNTNKTDVTLDLSKPRGRELLEGLIARSDAVVENFTPRVFEGFGLSWERIHDLNPRTIYMRMPAFGLSGPWRDNTGFAQTMEQLTGLAWLTGHPDDQPRIPRGPCDPLAGMHAALALLVAFAERDATGRGHHIECTMVEGALNAASEQLIEFSAYGNLMHRIGNRSRQAAPQGLYGCADGEPGNPSWLAISIATDAQWKGLREVLGDPAWAKEAALDTRAGRMAAHDAIDAHLRGWAAERERSEAVAALLAVGVPAAPAADPRLVSRTNEQLIARGFFEHPDHPVVGQLPTPCVPFRYASVDQWTRTPAPTLGEHNHEILGGLLGLSESEIAELGAEGIIGTRPEGL